MNATQPSERIILGIDPGTNFMGYAVLSDKNKKLKVLVSGTVNLKKLSTIYLKYQYIFQRITQILDEYKPDELAIESQFYGKNIQSTLKLGRAQGVAIAAALRRDVPIFEYAPRRIKLAITGRGTATKEQLAFFVDKILKLDSKQRTLDETDALAIALCHFFQKDKTPSAHKSKDWKDFIKKNPKKVIQG